MLGFLAACRNIQLFSKEYHSVQNYESNLMKTELCLILTSENTNDNEEIMLSDTISADNISIMHK
jgi:hypothetical protein